jgi:hypothetical protein
MARIANEVRNEYLCNGSAERSRYINLLGLATDDIETCPHKLHLLSPSGVKESNTYQPFSLAKCMGKAIQTVIEFPVLRRETGTAFPGL